MELYYFEALNPRKACAVARHLNAPVTFVRVDPAVGGHKTPDFLAINPNGKVPALVDGDMTLWETNAIMCYLADRGGSDLWPHDGRQIEIIRWFSWDASHFTRYGGTLYFENIIKPMFNLGPPDRKAVTEATDGFRQHARILSDHLAAREYLVGDGLTVADFAVAGALPFAEKAQIPLAEFPVLQRWHARLNALAAWREPFPAGAKVETKEMNHA